MATNFLAAKLLATKRSSYQCGIHCPIVETEIPRYRNVKYQNVAQWKLDLPQRQRRMNNTENEDCEIERVQFLFVVVVARLNARGYQ